MVPTLVLPSLAIVMSDDEPRMSVFCAPERMLMLLIHRLHNGTYDPGKDCTAAGAANRIAEKATQRAARRGVGPCSTPKETAKNCTSGDTADRTADNLG